MFNYHTHNYWPSDAVDLVCTGLEPPLAHHADGGDPGGAVPVRLGAHDADRPLGEGEGAEPDGHLLQEGQPGGRIRSR